jgi:hypothetical protein
MAIPDEVEDKLESNSSRVVQQEDIVRVIEESSKEKPWSRYMIQQHLDADPAKKTVKDRLDELVELEVLDQYEYTNQTLYDLAYDPIVTDGGHLRDANLVELATFRDRNSLKDLSNGLLITSFLFFGTGILAEVTRIKPNVDLTNNFYLDVFAVLYATAFLMFLLINLSERVGAYIPTIKSRLGTDML